MQGIIKMNNLLFLSEQDFMIDPNGPRGPVVCTKQKGIMFVMFMANPNVCKYCDLAKPEFMQLPHIINNVKFGICNLSSCPNLQARSLETITPLQKVPTFIVYINGRPVINYDNERTTKHFAEFMKQVLTSLSQQQGGGAAQLGQGGANGGQGGIYASQGEQMEKTAYGVAYDHDILTINDPSQMSGITCTEDGVCYFTNAEVGVNKQAAVAQAQAQIQQQQAQMMYQGGQPQHAQQMGGQGQRMPYNPNQQAMQMQMRQPAPNAYMQQQQQFMQM